jgi:hypothetical protein
VKAWGSQRNDLKLLAFEQFDRHCSKNRLGEADLSDLVLWRQRSRMAKAKKQTSRGQKDDRARLADGIPIVEVTAPDGSKSLWAAAVARDNAVAAVADVIPANHVATLSRHRLTLHRSFNGLRPGEARRIKL